MNRRSKIVFALVIVAAASSFLLGRQTTAPVGVEPVPAVAPAGKPCCEHGTLCRWLRLSDEQKQTVRATGTQFVGEAKALQQRLAEERYALAALLETPNSGDEEIMAQVERVIEAHDALERRVARHMLAIRPILTPEQAKQFMGLAASGVRRAGRCRMGPDGETIMGGRGQGGGLGQQRGRGQRGHGGGRGQ
jgi:Spy/CpxP family protein refolding chaperone